jgi:ABC-type amino acid transport system permease subunit
MRKLSMKNFGCSYMDSWTVVHYIVLGQCFKNVVCRIFISILCGINFKMSSLHNIIGMVDPLFKNFLKIS